MRNSFHRLATKHERPARAGKFCNRMFRGLTATWRVTQGAPLDIKRKRPHVTLAAFSLAEESPDASLVPEQPSRPCPGGWRERLHSPRRNRHGHAAGRARLPTFPAGSIFWRAGFCRAFWRAGFWFAVSAWTRDNDGPAAALLRTPLRAASGLP